MFAPDATAPRAAATSGATASTRTVSTTTGRPDAGRSRRARPDLGRDFRVGAIAGLRLFPLRTIAAATLPRRATTDAVGRARRLTASRAWTGVLRAGWPIRPPPTLPPVMRSCRLVGGAARTCVMRLARTGIVRLARTGVVRLARTGVVRLARTGIVRLARAGI